MSTDISPQPPSPELWQVLDEAARGCAPTVFPRDRVVRRARLIKRRRRLVTGTLAIALLTPPAISLALPREATHSPAVTSTRAPTPGPSVSRDPADDRSPVRVVRPGERIEAGLGVWYMLKKREYCDANPADEEPICVGYLDVNQPGAVPMTFNTHPLEKGMVYVFAYTGKTPAARITMTEDGRTTVLPIVRLAGRPAYVSSYAVGAPQPADASQGLLGDAQFRVYGADGKELARMGGR
ncbi:hypothetical protein OG866_02360 [Streptomyces sp. NBC_00663]|uniref:hypothetical protein n=1 Tax=Streptomyces sp. NBC_00663 TaxID=2975801 RepID=UPI002E30C1DD|nr:hypothetical protein [Streptomyces sp. NBC_00663]